MARPPKPLDPLAGPWQFLGYELRRLREEQGLSQSEAASVIGYEHGIFSKWELGKRPPPIEAMEALDEAWRTGKRLVYLHHFAINAKSSATFMTFAEYEAQAEFIRINAVSFIPGLLQTPEYAGRVFAAFGELDVEAQVAQRMERQKILGRAEPPPITVLLAETALLVMPPDVAKGQLERLLELSGSPRIGIRVVPLSAYLHGGLEGDFYILTTPEREFGFVETAARGRLVTEQIDLRRLHLTFERTGWVALSPEATRTKLREMIEALP